MAENDGLHLTTIMDQGDYIKLIVNSVLSNLIEGAVLAIIVLALFLKDIRPPRWWWPSACRSVCCLPLC